MKSMEMLEKAINDAFKDETDAKRIESLGAIKTALSTLKEEDKKRDDSMTEIAEKYRDALLQGGSFKPTGDEHETSDDDKRVSFEDCVSKYLSERNKH